jgi:hypothetical protein
LAENRQVAADGSLRRQVMPEDLEAFWLIPEIIGTLPVIAPLDALGVDGHPWVPGCCRVVEKRKPPRSPSGETYSRFLAGMPGQGSWANR